jgi:hypothetical protein
VRVRVFDDDGAPLEGARVLAGRRSRRTDAEGRVEFVGLASERLRLQAWHPHLDGIETESAGLEVEPSVYAPLEVELVVPFAGMGRTRTEPGGGS